MSNVQEWQQLANKELSRREKNVDSLVRQTAEGITIKPLYTEADLDNLEVTGTLPGLPPYVRCVTCHHVYRQTVNHSSYAGFSTAKESNAFYRRNLAAGQKAVPLPLTSPPTVVTTLTIRAFQATSVKQASLSTPLKI